MSYLNFVTKIIFEYCNGYQVVIHWLKLNSVTGIKMEFTYQITHIDSPIPHKRIINNEFNIEADYYAQYQQLIIKTDAEYPIEHKAANLDLAKWIFEGYLEGQVECGRLKLKSNHGGKRTGAGRKKTGNAKKVLRVTQREEDLIKHLRKRLPDMANDEHVTIEMLCRYIDLGTKDFMAFNTRHIKDNR
jgi:hypothetical protein